MIPKFQMNLQLKIMLLTIGIVGLMAFKQQQKTNIWLIGDSTMAWKQPSRAPESGWGEGLKLWVNDNAIVHNHAASGRSTKSFLAEHRWQPVLDSIRPGDYVIIQFGHNDEKPDSALHADSSTLYKTLLKKFVDETRSKSGIPIVCSPIIRRHFDSKGQIINTHGHYIEAAHNAASEDNALFVDMEAITRIYATKLGPANSMKLWVRDTTHLNNEGAKVVAGLFVQATRDQKMAIAKYFKTAE